ncbi:hypothetical protein SLA2020_403190 [Shorea laevis]
MQAQTPETSAPPVQAIPSPMSMVCCLNAPSISIGPTKHHSIGDTTITGFCTRNNYHCPVLLIIMFALIHDETHRTYKRNYKGQRNTLYINECNVLFSIKSAVLSCWPVL